MAWKNDSVAMVHGAWLEEIVHRRNQLYSGSDCCCLQVLYGLRGGGRDVFALLLLLPHHRSLNARSVEGLVGRP